jgi:hypothetical protein
MIEQASCDYFGALGNASIMSVVMDGMDQGKFRCPRNLPASKFFQDLARPTLHLCGVVVHGHSENYWISDADVKKDPNTEIDLLSRSIENVHQDCTQQGRPMPAHLSILADNCSREMKNQFTLLWGCWRIAVGHFRSVTYNYLVRGHSHSGIGQSTECSNLLFFWIRTL